MLQELNDLSVLGKDNQELLQTIGVDPRLLNEAAGDDTDVKDIRDKAYNCMKQAVDEIRKTGQYLFWRDEDRKKGYMSAYHKRRIRRPETASTRVDNE